MKIARNRLGIENQPALSTENQQYEWRRLVGSIRRRVQRHATQAETPEPVQPQQPIRRKSSLTTSKLDFLRREKSKEEPSDSTTEKRTDAKDMTLSKQKSVGFDFGTENPQTSRPKYDAPKHNSASTKTEVNIKIDKDMLFVRSSDNIKGVRKSDSTKSKDNVKVQKSSNFSFRSNCNKSGTKAEARKMKEQKNREDFLRATMRIFLVVSPPVGKMQVNNISLLINLL